MIEPVIHRILVEQYDIKKHDPAFEAAARMGLTIAGKEADREQQAVDKGVVISFGPTVFRDFGGENPLAVGDEIVFARHSGKAVEDPETKKKYVVINDEDVVAILRKKATDV